MSLVMRLMMHARLLGGEEVERQALEMGEDPDPEIVHHPGGETTGDLDAGALQQCGSGDRGEVQAGDERTTEKCS